MLSLNDYASNKTDKFELGYIDTFYDPLFIPVQYSTTSVLEIGVYKGDSVKLWRDFFINATIYGIDTLDLTFLKEEDRIVSIGSTDAYCYSTLDKLVNLSPNGFDIIIDDGPHTFKSMLFFIKNYVNLLKPKGILVLENIINTEWTRQLSVYLNSSIGKWRFFDMTKKIKSEELKVQWKKWKRSLDVIIFQRY